jgi:hypothetical protein
MNLLNELHNITDAPCNKTPIVIVWYEEDLDIARHFLRVCKWNEEYNYYNYIADNGFTHVVPTKQILGWCYL